jgi:paraquat-inducible protein B
MRKELNPVLIGAFVLGAIALSIGALFIWGSGILFRTRYSGVVYLDGAVNGLTADAPVKLRGVRVGSLYALRLVGVPRGRQGQPVRQAHLRVAAYFTVEAATLHHLGARLHAPRDLLRQAVENGLRARLESDSLLTGSRYLDLDFQPGTPMVLQHPERPGPPYEVPTIPAEKEQLTRSVRQLLAKLSAADFAGLIRSLDRAARSFDQLARVASETVQHLDPRLQRIVRDLDRATQEAHRTLTSVRGTADRASTSLGAGAPIQVEVKQALGSVDKAARSLAELVQYLRRNPSALIVGKKSARSGTRGGGAQ